MAYSTRLPEAGTERIRSTGNGRRRRGAAVIEGRGPIIARTEGRKAPRSKSRPITIGALSRATRIPVETLRTWERRYGAPKPERKPSGHRLYAPESVEHLRRVARLLARGHRPGEILGLSPRELGTLLDLAEPEPRPQADAGAAVFTDEHLRRSLAMALDAATALDRPSLQRELRTAWVRLGPLRFLDDFAGPFMVEVGRAWERKTIDVRHEHFASACVSDFLREVRGPFDQQARGPRVAAALLPGDGHEGGLLMACVLFAYRGYRVVYLGADTPVEEIAATAEGGDIDLVAVSVSSAVPRRRAAAAIADLRERLPRRMSLWVGGAGAPVALKGVERFANLSALDEKLSA